MATTATQTELSKAEQKLKAWRPDDNIPAWFNRQRRSARDAYFSLGLPERSDEAWHYGDPRKFSLDGLDIAHELPGFNSISYERICGLTGTPRRIACLSMLGDQAHEISSSMPLRDAGVTVMTLRQAIALREYQLSEYWNTALVPFETSKIVAAHYALVDNGFFVHIPKFVKAPVPIHLIMEAGEAGSVVAPHVLIVAEELSQADVYVHFLGNNNAERNLQLGLIRVHAQARSQVNLTTIQNLGSRSDAFTHEALLLERDAKVNSTAVHFGGNNTRHELIVKLTQPGANAKLFGLHLGRQRQRFDFLTHQHHFAPNTTSDLLFKGALLDKARSSYQGSITVAPGAQKTDAYQKNRMLLLSPQARADSSPQLEIEANDVRCSHGSTVSNIRRDELFYMQQRGIPAATAKQLIVSGFMADVADRIPLEHTRDYVYNYVLKGVS
jgi:Fe-S cluster assembly protein SufD